MAQQQQSGDEEVGKEKPGNGGAGTTDWRDMDVLSVGPVNLEVIKRRHGVSHSDEAYKNFIYFKCRHHYTGCKFSMRWAKQGGLLQQHGQHSHALMTPAKKWLDVDTLLPVGPVNSEVIKRRHGVKHTGGEAYKNFDYFQCRLYRSTGCKFTMRWAKQGGLLQQQGRGRHNHAVTQNEEVGEQEEEDGTGTESGGGEEEMPTVKREEDGTGTELGGEEEDMPTVKREEDGTGTNSGGEEEEEVRIVKYLQRDYKCLGRMVPEGEEKPSKESMPVHTIEEEEDEDMEEGTSQGTRKKKKRDTFYRYTQRQLPGPVKKEEPGAEEAEEEAPPPPQMPRIAIVVPQWLLQPHQPVGAAQPAKMLLRERKRRIDYGE